MSAMEIERKFLVEHLPEDLADYPKKRIEQAYLCTDPVVRVRRSDNSYYMTYKGRGLLAREGFTDEFLALFEGSDQV